MRSKIVAGNWKMNNNSKQTKELIKGIRKSLKRVPLKNNRVIVAPTFVNLSTAIKRAKKSKIEVVAQNMHQSKNGAFTAEPKFLLLSNKAWAYPAFLLFIQSQSGEKPTPLIAWSSPALPV